MMLTSACAQSESPDTDQSPEATESPSPEPQGTFELQGIVLEALGSTQGSDADPDPAPTDSPNGEDGSEDDEDGSEDDGEDAPDDEAAQSGGAVIEGSAPGSLSIRLNAYSGEDTSCIFEEGDTITVAFTRATEFTPEGLSENARFPRNLRETNVDVRGMVVDEETCLLAADSVAELVEAEPSPTTEDDDDDESDSATESPSPSSTESEED
ncbi:MAG: hypothetical protein WD602_03955 [Actinomycetota bacterium]